MKQFVWCRGCSFDRRPWLRPSTALRGSAGWANNARGLLPVSVTTSSTTPDEPVSELRLESWVQATDARRVRVRVRAAPAWTALATEMPARASIPAVSPGVLVLERSVCSTRSWPSRAHPAAPQRPIMLAAKDICADLPLHRLAQVSPRRGFGGARARI